MCYQFVLSRLAPSEYWCTQMTEPAWVVILFCREQVIGTYIVHEKEKTKVEKTKGAIPLAFVDGILQTIYFLWYFYYFTKVETTY